MVIEYDEKGKKFTDIVSKVAVDATLQTTTHLMHGQIHIRRDQRLKDELDRDENFLAVTEVSVLSPDGNVLYEVPFLAVRRDKIVWVIQDSKPGEEQNS